MDIRSYQEKLEETILSPYAKRSSESRGREIEESGCDIRTVYQRDRDRVLYSKAFRRLKHKTQVFISPEGDHYRTRLTHTLEVSQIARTVARSLRLNEDLTEAIALGHDLGHTPFGHAGERVLDMVCTSGFKHNEQSVRVVEVLEKEREGLNLTWEVRNGILCHTGNEMPSTLEGCVVRYADKIAYINHYIEDAIRGSVIHESDIPEACSKVLGNTTSSRINCMIVSIIENSYGKPEIKMDPLHQEAMNRLRSFMFDNVYVGSVAKREESKAEAMVAQLYEILVRQPERLPEDYRPYVEKEGLERTVLDYIAGMTDRYAVRKFQEIFVPKSWLT